MGFWRRAKFAALCAAVLCHGLVVASPASAEVFETITTPGDGWDVTFHPTNQNYGFFVGHHEIGELGCFYRVDPDGAGTGKAQGDGCFDGDFTLSLGTDKVGMKSSVWVTSDGNTAYVPLNSEENANQRSIAKVNISDADPTNWSVNETTVNWAADMQYWSNSVMVDDVLYALSSTGWLTLDTDTDTAGEVAFSGNGPAERSSVYVADGKLWAVSSDSHLHCYDLTTGALCAGNGWTNGKSSETFNIAPLGLGVVEYRNTNGTFGGFCMADSTSSSCLNSQGVNDTTMVNPFEQLSGEGKGTACSDVLHCTVSRQHQVILHRVTTEAPSPWHYDCWDYTTQAACSNFTPTEDNLFAGQVYTIIQDPWEDSCFWSNAHDNKIGVWEISHTGGFVTSGGECDITSATSTVTLEYDPRGGWAGPGDQTGNAASNVTVSTTEPTRDGYTFTGWNTAADGSGTSYSGDDTYTLPNSGTDTLYAQWQPVTTTTTTAPPTTTTAPPTTTTAPPTTTTAPPVVAPPTAGPANPVTGSPTFTG